MLRGSRHIWIAAGLFFGAAGLFSASARVRPNIVLVLIDDMGRGDLSCFGNQEIKTPVLDQMAAEGLRFEQFYVAASVCSPSRAGILTGQYPWRWHINSYLGSRQMNNDRGMAQWLDTDAPSLARFFQEEGYATGHFGKWHLGGQRDVGEAPLITQYGFDKSLTNFEGLGPRVLNLCYTKEDQPPKRWALGSDKLGHGPIEWVDRSKVTGRYVQEAVDFINQAAQEHQPFFVNVWPDDVHSPFYPPLDQRVGKKHKLFSAVLKNMDQQLAPLFDMIRNDPSLRNNTVVFICSDNGPEHGAGTAGEFRGGKQMLYEGGVRSPLIVWAPGFMPADRCGTWNHESVVSSLDFAPSLLALAGVSVPKRTAFDGESLPDIFLGKSSASREGPLLFRLAPDGKKDSPQLAGRFGPWKLLCQKDGTQPELYNLESDPKESRNMAEAYPERVDQLKKELLAWDRQLPEQPIYHKEPK